MTTADTIQHLRGAIVREIAPLVDREYRYLSMTDHGNVGDTMIFEGERSFLATLPFRCKEWTTMRSFLLRRPTISDDDLLIFRGSGSFGDLWPVAPSFWMKALHQYPRNPVLFMPQTAYFENPRKRDELARACTRPGRTVICVRDKPSFDLVRSHFNNEVHLAPDMAFFMDVDRWTSPRISSNGRKLLIRRTDCESNEGSLLRTMLERDDIDVSDWPTMSPSHPVERWKSRIGWMTRNHPRIYDFFVRSIYRPALLGSAVRFVEPYEEVFATRMHGGILSLLLGKQTTFFDNSYGKTRAVFDTWLATCDSAQWEVHNG